MDPASFQLPPALEAGSVISAIAPAGAFDPRAAAAGTEVLRSRFFSDTRWLQGPDEAQGFYAGPVERRREVLREVFTQPITGPIWAIRGGSGCAQPLEGFDRMVSSPRWVVGFSDITALHLALHRRGWITMHGPNLVNVADWQPQAVDEVWQWLTGRRDHAQYVGRSLRSGRGTGPLIGGNLTVLASLCGTWLTPRFAGRIVVLEDVAEAPYRLDRALHQLIFSGAFVGCRGVALGQFSRCGSQDALGPIDRLTATLAPLGVPILGGLSIGHDNDSRAIPFGTLADLDADSGTLTVRAWP